MKTHGIKNKMNRNTSLRLALLATACMAPAMEVAAGSFQSIGMNVVNGTYNTYYGAVYEWRHNDTIAQSLPSGCNTSTAPIVVLFHGGNGIDSGNAALTEYMTTLAQRLSTACVRMVSVQGRTAYTVNAPPNASSATSVPNQAALNIATALTQIMSAPVYRNASKVIYFGGSMSGLFGAVLLRNQYANYTNDAVPYWSKLDRFVVAGPPAGNLYDACKLSNTYNDTARGTATLFTGGDCVSFLRDFNAITGRLMKPFTAAEVATLRSKIRVHMLVGTLDDLWGYGKPGVPSCNVNANPPQCWTGQQGVDNYLATSGLSSTVYRNIDAVPPSSSPITFTQITGAGHSNVWNYNAGVESGICKLISRDFPGTLPNNCDSAVYAPREIRGVIDSVQGNTIHGWACAAGNPHAISVHLYAGGPAGAGALIGGYKAYSTSETAVATACASSGTAYRFHIPLPLNVRQQWSGRRIYIHGIHPTGAYRNELIANSGVFAVPAP